MKHQPEVSHLPVFIETTEQELAHILLCSFRYSLGRMTYITGMCADWLVKYWRIMPECWRSQIHRDIREAIRTQTAGMACDVAQWERVLQLPVKEDDDGE